jgi:hypothetical protein
MNKRQIITSLSNIANNLDNTGLYRDANRVTQIMVKMSKGMDYTYEEMVENDKRRKEEYEQILADKVKRKIGDDYKNLDRIKETLKYFFEKWRKFHFNSKGKKWNILQKMKDRRMIDSLVDKFYELFATKSRKDVEREFYNFVQTSRDEFYIDDTEINTHIIVPFYHTFEETDNNRGLRTYRPFTFEED